MESRLIRLPEVIKMVGLGKTAIYALMKEGKFPKQVPLFPGCRYKGWVESEVRDHIAAQIEHARAVNDHRTAA